MTRTAKRGPENKKKHDATEWNALKPDEQSQPPRNKQRSNNNYNNNRSNWNQRGGGAWNRGGAPRRPRTGEEQLLHSVLHKEQRRERRREKREKDRVMQKVCFKCRLPGHKVDDCLMSNSNEGTGLCYRCGSTEHMSSTCKAKLPAGKSMPFASCYVCGKQGHIAKACPDNPKGLYPMGGGCKTCGSVEHFQRDCSEYLEKQGIGSTKVKLLTMESSVDAEEEEEEEAAKPQPVKKKKAKVVMF